MRLSALIIAVVVGLLLGWGGLAAPGAAKAAGVHRTAGLDLTMLSAERVVSVDCEAQEQRPGGGGGGGGGDAAAFPDRSCCVMIHSVSIVEPTGAARAVDWTPVVIPMQADVRLRDVPLAPFNVPRRLRPESCSA